METEVEEVKKEAGPPGGPEDERLDFIFEYLSKSLRLKHDKWAKMMGNEELKGLVMEFLERTSSDVLVMTINPAGVLSPMLGFPTNTKSKSSYFVRKRKEPVTRENLRELLIFGDMAPRPVDELAVLVDEVFMPLLVNPVNNRGWPAVVAEDVKKHLYGLKCDLYEVRGQMHGQTLLPMPLDVGRVFQAHRDIVDSNGEIVDVHLKSSIEGVVIKWASQINQVLSEDPATAFPGGYNPVPHEEVKFWNERRKNLEGIYRQLCDPRVKKMGSILELTESAYFPCFKTLFRNVVAALTEVRDICIYLKPVEAQMEVVGAAEFSEVCDLLPAVMHTVCLLWANSRYYCTAPRVMLLIREISNQLINQSSNYLDPGSLFQGELDEAQERVAMCITTLERFKEVFEESRAGLGSGYFKSSEPVFWNFHQNLVFERLNDYVKRLKLVEVVFDAGVEYSKLEKVEVGGLKGRILGQKVEELFEEFKNIFSGFTKIEYDPLNPDDNTFEKDKRSFDANLDDLERRLAAIIAQAFDDCHNFESLSKLVLVSGSLLDREKVKTELRDRYPRVLEVYSKDLDVVKTIFDEYVERKNTTGYYDVDLYFPPTAGAMTFLHKLRQRIQTPIDFFNEWDNPIVQTADFEHVKSKYEEMKERLDSLWDSLYSEWAARVPGEVSTNLAKTLLTRHDDKSLSTNYAPELVAALREVRYMRFLDIEDIPAPARELFDRSEELHLWVTTLNRIVEWYNEILRKCIPVEFDLIREEMSSIDNFIAEVQSKLNWKSDGVWPYIENIRDLTKALHSRVIQAQDNVDFIKGLLDNFAYTPLFERDEKIEGLMGLSDRVSRVSKRNAEVRNAGEQILLKMDENYKLFHNIPITVEEPEAPLGTRKRRIKKRYDEDGNEIPYEEGEEEWESYDEEEDEEEEQVEEEPEESSASSEESSSSSEDLWSSDSDDMCGGGLERRKRKDDGKKAVKEQAVEGWDVDQWAAEDEGDQDEWTQGDMASARLLPELRMGTELPEDLGEDGDEAGDGASSVASGPGSSQEGDLGSRRASAEEPAASRRSSSGAGAAVSAGGPEGASPGSTGAPPGGPALAPTGGSGASPAGGSGASPGGGSGVGPAGGSSASPAGGSGLGPADGSGAGPAGGSSASPAGGSGAGPAGGLASGSAGGPAGGSLGGSDLRRASELSGRSTATTVSSGGASVSLDLSVSEDVLPTLQEEPEHSQEWMAYLDYVDNIVLEKLTRAIQTSVDVFFEETNSDRNAEESRPLFEVFLELKDPDIVFNPSLDDNERKSFYRLVEGLLFDVVHMSELIPRVAPHKPRPHYRKDIHQNSELNNQLQEILIRVRTVMSDAQEYCEKFNVHHYLWMDDRQELFGQFLKYGHYLTQEELDELAAAEEGTNPLKESPPSLEQFHNLIELYEGLHKELEEIETVKVFDKWFRVNIMPFKQALLNTVCKWSNMIKDHLVDHVINSLRGLAEFNEEAERELNREVKEGDYEALLSVMNYLGKVRDRRTVTDTMFEPIKDTIELLKTYDVEFPEEIYVQLQELPDSWNNVKKIAIAVRTAVSPLITHEMNLIRRRIAVLDARQLAYREAFKKMPIFRFECTNCYEEIDQAHKDICELESDIAKISESAALFEVNVPDFRGVKMCRKEIKMVKQLWDYVNVVRSSLDEWKTTPWREIDVDTMDVECKKFGKELRTLDKEMRGWDTFVSLEALLKNMVTSLRAVSELQNPAIRDRHWRQLMKATKVKIVIDENTVLDDLLQLNLHLFEDEVKTIVDKSVKEMSMEKVLRELDATWKEQEFEREEHPRTGVQLIRTSEELIETLEENQVQLQNMMSSKFIDFFANEVSEWQSRLGNADAVISIWMEVQRTWCHLESIFVGSEDIRSQLPEDCTRFDMVDVEFKKLLEEITKEPNIVRFTNKKKLYEKLEELQGHLTKCEKALAEYLETKRLAYPRFYFVSSADLLDILSNGNQPALVARHLTKLYDSMARLKMVENSNMAEGMWAKDGEYVQFSQKCDCDGKVEVWLNRVTDTMRVTGRHYFKEAVVSYDEKPREQWIFDYPAQCALVGTQIWWTTEVNIAFSRLEEGYENALKDYNRKQVQQLNTLIGLLLGDLSAEDRQKIMTICTIDVHSRDVVSKMISQKVESSSAFQWQSQLRHRWDEKVDDCFCNICDAQFRYDYEYLGCTPRLVITPLTDRCYITLTQSLHLIMGGAPAGPAGTGKTETTKDLGRAMGVMVYVFNCSEQMDYKSCGNIYKGLAQTGAWGCFDEFNRISVEVLSVVAVQVKTVLDAIRFKKTRFNFMGETISLTPTVGMFITMNPGYAGRTELPENLKVLFRPCAMVVPDFELICEIMLVAEGFQEARLLARKFITLYTLCRELLSKQDHYDWGLRAIKSVLVVAGSLKRGDRQRPEDQVLMRALRDFNVPKIITDDIPVFMGLIGDLFPALDVPRKRDLEFEKAVRLAATDLQLQPEDNFILKVVQLVELLEVRHSVFIIGFAGTGKSMVWKTLFKTYQNMKMKPFVSDLNPKAVTNDELFGVINPSTREWKDGLFSVLMRDIANMSGDGPRWIMLDGDIDPMWIESLNTVMDDNKVLTLASNERIAMTKSMRLLFEISNLRTATPATVSRAGILYINPTDLGWNPYVTSWIDKRDQPSEKANLLILFDKYVPPTLEALRTKFKKITPVPEIAHVMMLCHLLDCFLTDKNLPPECPKEWVEIYFVFSCVWAFGSVLFQDQLIDWRNEFHKWWVNEFKVVKFPAGGTVFSYFIDPETKKFLPWGDLMIPYEFDPDVPLQATLVSTSETTRLRIFMDLLLPLRIPVMLVGGAGSGKTVIVNGRLNKLTDKYMVTNVPFNFYTTSEMLQRVLEKPLEKKAGRNYGPPGNKNLIYFIDDMNMPEVDKYFTVQPHTLIRQHLDYNHWYDRSKLTLKDIHNCQYVSCMNPTAGSFTIDPRLQRHFFVFAVSFPGEEALNHIYTSIVMGHLSQSLTKFNPAVMKMVPSLVQAALFLHTKMSASFLPTAIKFHYLFNLRDLANIFQGILFSTPDCLPDHSALVRLWIHEATRVYCDKLVDEPDRDQYRKLLLDSVKKIEGIDEAAVLEKPNIFVHFAEGIGETKYLPVSSWETIHKLLVDALAQYNDMVASMNLVLFEDAMDHICRISRILMGPRGNALLVGVGGSGKQSLTRLAAFICNLDVFQVQLRKGYSIPDLKADLALLYQKAGLKSAGLLFLMTDAQVPDERFLVIINDMLASGEVPDLFADDEVETIINQMRAEVKGVGMQDTRENCWKFFINRVRTMLKTVLCFSPVGSTLRTRSRKFPAITNCTAINWFNEWPYEALQSVSLRFLSELEALPENLRKSVSEFMSYVHSSVNEMSHAYLTNERRYNYTTPKSFLEQIELYSKLLNSKSDELSSRTVRLQNGLEKLASCGEQVDGLKEVLAVQEVEVRQKNAAADELIVVVSKEAEKVSKEKAIAAEEERKVMEKEEEVAAQKKICEQDLKAAEPALIAAEEALNTLNKNNLTELKALASPPVAVTLVTAAAMVLLAPKGKVPKERGWKESKAFMGKVDTFLDNLLHYDKENIHPDVVKAIKPYLANKEFNPEQIRTKSTAAAGLCAWCINIMAFHEVYEKVEPKRRALQEKNNEWMAARQRLAELKSKLEVLEGELAVLTNKFEIAVAEKKRCQQEADSTAETIDLANRLVTGLGSESVRWQEAIANFQKQRTTLPGDILLVTAFISYVGGFTRSYRVDLQEKKWLPFLKTLNPAIPLTEDLDPLSMLTDDAQVAAWNNEGLPSDSMSIENATIIMNSARWPLMIDPQLQGIKWIKNRYGKSLKVVRLGQKSYLDIIERAICRGKTVLIEFIGESVDAVLEPLLSRALINKGRAIKMGDREIDYNPKFRLILQTKLANPHYKPEMQAQTTLINFTVTRDGLEEQLLAEVVKAERPDLESLRMELTTKQNSYKIDIKNLEDELLQRLSSAGENVLSDKALVLNLERTKRTAEDIVVKVEESKVTGQRIDEAREHYRPAAARAALLYFILNDLHKINPVYQFSLKAYTVVFHRGIQLAAPADVLQKRVFNLIDSITYQTYMYTSRGLFEADKLIFMTQMAVQILLKSQEIEPVELDFLLRYPFVTNLQSPVDFLSDSCWGGIVALSNMPEFKNLDKDIEGAAKRWRTFVESEAPEKEKYPGDWKGKSALQRLCMMRALRPDRMIYATQAFIEEKLGAKFIESRSVPFEKSYEESSPTTPVFFILSPGVDPLKDVEKLGTKLGFTTDKRNFHNVSLGQGQEPVAEKAMKKAAKKGHWVILQNIHLVANWLPSLEKRMDKCAEKPHPNYRLYMSAEPAPAPEFHILPQGVLESSIKITNEPPTGMHANLHMALDNFSQETMEMCSKEAEFKSILFALCYFHAVVAERRKFGSQGWNRIYPFNFGDLTISANVLYNYLEANNRVPWEDLRYLFGEIMYGGHITDDWDRRLCATYLEEYLQAELVDGDLQLAVGFTSPPNSDYQAYHQYIDDYLPPESPMLYGLHPNAEISSLTATSEKLFKTVFEMQPRDAGPGVGVTISREEKVKQTLSDILERLPEPFSISEMMGKVEDRTPYVIVAFQECERMNQLMAELRQSLSDLDLGLKGELTITVEMESLEQCLFIDRVPENWAAKAYPSLLPLSSWFADLQLRLKELENWTQDFIMPGSVWLAGFFNPQSFLTAIMQSTARKNEWPLDKMCLQCDVTKKGRDDFSQAPREGANVHGLYMEGARWDVSVGSIVESRHKELFPLMPVIYVRAITQDKQETRNIYQCPVYKTRQRGPTFVWTFNLKTREKPTKWTLAGVALLLST